MKNKSTELAQNPPFCKTDVRRSVLIIWCSDLQEAEDLWQKVYMLDGWDVDQPIEVKWNWKRFDYLYTFRVSKHFA
jgi:hypothetical protein